MEQQFAGGECSQLFCHWRHRNVDAVGGQQFKYVFELH